MTFNFLFAKHGSAAAVSAAMARNVLAGFGVIDVVVVRQLFAGSDVAQGDNPDAIINLVGLTVGLAGMIHKSRHAKAVNDCFSISHAIQVGDFAVGVETVGFLCGETRACVFQDVSSSRDRSGGVDTGTMQRRGSDD